MSHTERFAQLTRKEQLIYIAGLFDGEGCIGLYNIRTKTDTRTPNFQLVFRVAQKTPFGCLACKTVWPIGRLSSLAGKGPNRPGPYFAFKLVTKNAELALRELIPFLREKREQAVLALEYIQVRRAQRDLCKQERRRSINAKEVEVHEDFLVKIRNEKLKCFDLNYFSKEIQ